LLVVRYSEIALLKSVLKFLEHPSPSKQKTQQREPGNHKLRPLRLLNLRWLRHRLRLLLPFRFLPALLVGGALA